LIDDWDALDRLLSENGGLAGVIRTCHWHDRSIPSIRERYGVTPSTEAPLPGGLVAHVTVRGDELAVWLPEHRALVFGDVLLRRPDGTLTLCPESWLRSSGGRAAVRPGLYKLLALDSEHVLVSHGPTRLGDAVPALARALES
jgi:hypothetical protein